MIIGDIVSGSACSPCLLRAPRFHKAWDSVLNVPEIQGRYWTDSIWLFAAMLIQKPEYISAPDRASKVAKGVTVLR